MNTIKVQMRDALVALSAREGGIERVAEEAGLSAESLRQVVAGYKLPSGNPRGLGPTTAKKLDIRYPGWHLLRGMAHAVSELLPIVTSQPLDWGDLMESDLPLTFSLVVRDDAMAPTLNKGDLARFDRRRDPRPGRYALIEDRDGGMYIREYRVKRGELWQAIAHHPAYQPLDSETDGLRVVATMIGFDWA